MNEIGGGGLRASHSGEKGPVREPVPSTTPEHLAAQVRNRHRLSSLHIFSDDCWPMWRVFGARRDAKGAQASVEEGRGETISAALRNLDERLTAGVFVRKPWE